jgi:hypothetical protein
MNRPLLTHGAAARRVQLPDSREAVRAALGPPLAVRSSCRVGNLSLPRVGRDTRGARPRSRVCDPDSSMAMMDRVHVVPAV